MAPKIQTRTEIRYKRAQWILGTPNLKKKKKSAAGPPPPAIFGWLTRMRARPAGLGWEGTSLLLHEGKRRNVFSVVCGSGNVLEAFSTNCLSFVRQEKDTGYGAARGGGGAQATGPLQERAGFEERASRPARMTPAAKYREKREALWLLEVAMVTGRSGGFLATGPSSVKAIASSLLQPEVNPFRSGWGEGRL